jgi:hypothetical protein
MTRFERSDIGHRILLLLIFLYLITLCIMVFVVPPGFDPDSGWGFMVMHNMERGAAFNRLVTPDPANIANNNISFLSWWSPGQYMVAYILKLLLGVTNGHAISLTIAGSYLLGLTGFYLFFKKLGFSPPTAALSIGFIATQLFFVQQFVYYNGGELLLFAFIGWFLFGCFSFDRVTWRAMAFIFFAGLAGFFCKSSVLWMLAAGLCCMWVNISLKQGGAKTGSLLLHKESIALWLKNGLLLLLPLVAMVVVVNVFYLAKGANPSSAYGQVQVTPEAFLFPLAAPLVAGFSVDELVDGLIYQPDGHTLSYPAAIGVLAGLALLCLFFVRTLIKSGSPRQYIVAFVAFYVFSCTFFCLMYLRQYSISYEARHFRILGLLAVPGVIHLLSKWRTTKVLFVCGWCAFTWLSVGYFSREYSENRRAARGNLGLSEQLYDTSTMKEILKLDSQYHGDAVFVLMSSDIGAEIVHNRVIVLNTEITPGSIFSGRCYSGKCGPLFILVPSAYCTRDIKPALNKMFTGYQNFSAKRLSADYYLYAARD